MVGSDPIFYNTILLMLCMLVLGIVPSNRYAQVVEVPHFSWSFLLSVFVIWVIASFPIQLGTWTDRAAYASAVLSFQRNGIQVTEVFSGGEWVFQLYTYFVSIFATYKGWFYVTAAIYVINYLIVSRRLTKEYAYVLFFSFVCNFQFYGYGMNTIRAGFAASFVMLGLTFCNKIWVMFLCFFIAMYSHSSMALPILALLLAYKLSNPKLYIWIWVLAIPLSMVAGSIFQQYLMGITDERRTSYLAVDAMSSARFRWDFLAYSAAPVLLGYYYIFKLNFKSQFYQWVYCAYLIANAVWILVIKAEYTDRFAYLSWFMFPILLLYPVLTKQLFYNVRVQRNHIAMTLACQYAFCYYMYLAYNGFKPF